MVDTDYGAGIELTQDLDLKVDSTGDISSVDGVDELEKDLAFQLIRVFTDEVGGLLSPKDKSRARRLARVTINQDPRVQDVRSVDVERESKNTVTIDADVRAGDAVEQFVFEV